MRRLQLGFSIVSAIFILVVLAFLGVAMATFSTTQQQSAAMDVMGSRAYQAARAGVEWAAYNVTQTAPGIQWGGCAPGATVDVSASPTLAPFSPVMVNCTATSYTEGTATVWIYDVNVVAQAGGMAGDPDYVQRVINVKLGR